MNTEIDRAELTRSFEPDTKERNPWDPEIHPEQYNYIQGIIDYVDSRPRVKKYSKETKLKVCQLSDKGYTLRKIAEETGVSKSTAYLYIKKYKKEKHQVKKPGSSVVIDTEVNLREVDLGKIGDK